MLKLESTSHLSQCRFCNSYTNILGKNECVILFRLDGWGSSNKKGIESEKRLARRTKSDDERQANYRGGLSIMW